jgi:hypothetical protein
LASPPLSAELLAGLTKPGAVPPPPPPPGGVIVRLADRPAEPSVAVTVAVWLLATDVVLTVNVALVAPAGTVTLAGVDAELELSLSETTVPPLGAAAVNVTVPVEDVPPTTVAGLRLTADNDVEVGVGFTVIDVNRVVPFSDAVRLTVVVNDDVEVAIVKLALVAPAGTMTLAGTLATVGSWLERSTGTSTDCALPSLTVPVADCPPVTLVGLTV